MKKFTKEEKLYLESIAPKYEKLWATFTPNMRAVFRKFNKNYDLLTSSIAPSTTRALLYRRVVSRSTRTYITRKPAKTIVKTIYGDELLNWLEFTGQLTKDKINAV